MISKEYTHNDARRAIEDALAPLEQRIEARIDALAKQLEVLRQVIETLKDQRISFAVLEQRLAHVEVNAERTAQKVDDCERNITVSERDTTQFQTTLQTLSTDLNAIKQARDLEAAERRKEMLRYGGLSGLVATLIPLLFWLFQLASGAQVSTPPVLQPYDDDVVEKPAPQP